MNLDPHLILDAEHAAPNELRDGEFIADGIDRLRRIRIRARRGFRRDVQAADAGQVGNQRVVNAVDEICLLGIAGKVFEREHGNRMRLGMRLHGFSGFRRSGITDPDGELVDDGRGNKHQERQDDVVLPVQ